MNQVAKQISPVNQFRSVLEGSMRAEVAKQLPKGVDPDRFIRTTITTVQMNPELLNANRSSLFASCMQAAKDGLLPDGREATIQIYNTKIRKPDGGEEWVKMAQYMPMVRGLIKKMYEAGCTKVDGVAVYEKDDFVYELGDDPKIEHRPYLGTEDPGPVIASYAIVKLENGEIKREVMPRRDIDKVREASKSSSGPGWSIWYDQFAIKAVLKRIYKQVPGRSDEFEAVAEADNQALGITFDNHHAEDMPVPALENEKESVNTGAAKRLVSKIKDKVEPDGLAPENAAQEAEEAIVEGESMSIRGTEGHNPEAEEKPKLEDIPGLTKGMKTNVKDGKKDPKDQSTAEYIADMDKPSDVEGGSDD